MLRDDPWHAQRIVAFAVLGWFIVAPFVFTGGLWAGRRFLLSAGAGKSHASSASLSAHLQSGA